VIRMNIISSAFCYEPLLVYKHAKMLLKLQSW